MFHVCFLYVFRMLLEDFFGHYFLPVFSTCFLLVYLLFLVLLYNFMAGRKILSNGPGVNKVSQWTMTSYVKYIFYTGLFKVEHALK